MENNIKRRRLLKIIAFSSSVLAFPNTLWASGKKGEFFQWQGTALGADTSIQLYSKDGDYTHSVLKECQTVIKKYEAMFSLFDEHSDISRLNKNGMIKDSSPEFAELIRLSKEFYNKSNGAFDITIQPLWNLYQKNSKNKKPFDLSKELSQVLPLIGTEKINVNRNDISFMKKGMGISLNGIAQGYITDKVTQFLEQKGFTNALVDIGEYRALGPQNNGQPWRIGLLDPFDEISIADVIEIERGAVSTSGGYGVKFDETGKYHHLFDPKTGQSSHVYASVTVKAENTTVADALSTAFSNMSISDIERLMKQYVNVETRLTYETGEVHILKS